ncbi:sn-glycerol-3-phosphate transporter [Pseudomonas silvicola]|nr:sn-glycerol-3-phosphate transporter [Pseudomonas silvicola]
MKYPGLTLAGATLATLLATAPALGASEEGFWYLQGSVFTRHFASNGNYNNHQDLLGLERNQASGLIMGGAAFRNSFSQRSEYAYIGKRFDVPDSAVYYKLSAGLIHGYRGKYRDKLPLNRFGVAPAVIPAIGAHWGPVAAEAVLLGLAATMVNVGLRF